MPYIFIGRDLYNLNEDYTQDELKDNQPVNVDAHMKLGTLLTGHQTLIKGAFASFDIKPEKIKDVIGRGGEMITKIILECSNVKSVSDKDAVKVDISDEGHVVVYHMNQDIINRQ